MAVACFVVLVLILAGIMALAWLLYAILRALTVNGAGGVSLAPVFSGLKARIIHKNRVNSPTKRAKKWMEGRMPGGKR